MIAGSTLHFHARFDLVPREGTTPDPGEVYAVARTWIRKKYAYLAPDPQTFVGGGLAQDGERGRVQLRTSAEPGSRTSNAPEWWAMRLEHPCSQFQLRQWRVDVGATRIGDRIRVSTFVYHWILPRYIGAEPPMPGPSAPGLVGQLFRLRGKDWYAMSGQMPLSDDPLDLPAGNGDKLITMLCDPRREAPLVLVSRNFPDGDTPLPVNDVARKMAGAATFFVSADASVDKELEQLLPALFRCWGGRVRVYQPGVNLDRESDSRRHRYFTPDQIVALGPEQVIERLVTGIARRPAIRSTDDVHSIEDVSAKAREVRLQELRSQLKNSADKELLELYDQENRELQDRLKRTQTEVEQKSEEIEELLIRCETAEDGQKAAEAQQHTAWRERGDAFKQAAASEARFAALDGLRNLPTDLLSVVRLIQDLHGERLIFTPQAIQAAADASFCDRPQEVAAAWRALWEMATTLLPIFLSDERVDLELRFLERTGFGLAMAESKATQGNPNLMRLRKQVFEGREIDIVPHLKLGTDQRPFRIHFAVDRDNARLIIGHCGDHLDTAGTRRRG